MSFQFSVLRKKKKFISSLVGWLGEKSKREHMNITKREGMEMAKRNRLLVLCVVLFIAFAFGCGGPEEKKLKFLNKGKELYEKGKYTEAKLEFKNAIQIDPKYVEAYYMLGMAEMKTGNLAARLRGFHRRRWSWTRSILKAHVELGRLYLGARMLDKAQEEIDIVLKEEPKNEEARLLQGAVYLMKQEYAKAKSLLEGLLAEGVTKPDVYMMLAMVSPATGGDESAVLQKGIAGKSESRHLYHGTGRVPGCGTSGSLRPKRPLPEGD